MATKRRERSESGFYHVYQRGVALFDVFEDDVDRRFFLERLKKYSDEIGIEIHAWCLMSNHMHLLLKAKLEALSAMMRKLGSVYARFFNTRHMRSGPLFEGRFCSVCVESDAQFMNTIRYIHRNPIHHEETTLCGSYAWSSYGEYLSAEQLTCEIGFALQLFGSVDSFTRFHSDRDGDWQRHLDAGTSGPLRDEEARLRANEALARSGFDVPISQIGTLPHGMRNKAIACVKRLVGCSLRQIQRLTAIAYSAIRRALELTGKPTEEPSPESARFVLRRLADSLNSPFTITSGDVVDAGKRTPPLPSRHPI